jgi:outer membrane receptor protein involved in Fe transport
VTLNSPRLLRRAQVHLAYARLRIEGQGEINGGLTDFAPPADYFPLDHDQRHTLNIGGEVSLPWRSFVATNIYYGSGFVDGEGPEHLSGHTTFDLSVGKTFGEKFSLSVHALNAANRRFLLDNSNTFGGTHYADPRQIYVTVRYKFHY